MGSTEMAANLFRATQTEDKLRQDGFQGKQEANHVHFQVGQKVRQTIKDIGGTMPEDLPTPDEVLPDWSIVRKNSWTTKVPASPTHRSGDFQYCRGNKVTYGCLS